MSQPVNPPPPSIHIVGTGAIGCLLAAGAARSNITYRLYPRRSFEGAIQVQSPLGDICLTNISSARTHLGNDAILVLPVKSYQVGEALRQWQPFLSDSTPVVLMQNGMGGYENARSLLGEKRIILVATTRQAALKKNAKHVIHTGVGTTDIGTYGGDDAALFNQHSVLATFIRVFGEVNWHDNMAIPLWKKLAINAVINPLTAMYNIRNGHLREPRFQAIIEQLCIETAQIAASQGVTLCASALTSLVLKVANDTGENYSSMHQDIAQGRPSEIDAINGYIVRLASKNGILVPQHAALFNAIKQLERS